MGISQHIHGTDNLPRCLISLALMTGDRRPVRGLHPFAGGQNNVQGASDAGLMHEWFWPGLPAGCPDGGERSAFPELCGKAAHSDTRTEGSLP